MRNILLIGISLVLLTAGMALAVDDAACSRPDLCAWLLTWLKKSYLQRDRQYI